ncbi:MAG: carbonic anhydrase [Planctomycetaceae bacterium]|nr:carbonic anhydrase [Planctomycetaceae bacterium]
MQNEQGRIIETLKEGNARFVAGKRANPHDFLVRVRETAENGQHPIAAILSCSDSRVPPEIIFDQGIGDIFSVRIAGNVCRDSQLGAIELGVKFLEIPLCVVLGHTQCGAVIAVCTDLAGLEPNVQSLVESIHPALERVRTLTGKTGREIVEDCCRENIFVQMETMLKKSGVLREAVRRGKLSILGAVYDINTGHVTFLGPHPQNDQLVTNKLTFRQ